MTTTATKPLAAHQIEALRYLAAHPSNPVYPDGVPAGTLALLRRRGLVGKHKPNRRTQTTSPLTDAGRALLASLDAGPLSPDSAAMLQVGIESGRTEPSVYLGSFASDLPAFEATFVVTGDDEQDDRGRPRARYISHEFNAATIVRAEVLARQWAERDGGCDFVEIAPCMVSP